MTAPKKLSGWMETLANAKEIIAAVLVVLWFFFSLRADLQAQKKDTDSLRDYVLQKGRERDETFKSLMVVDREFLARHERGVEQNNGDHGKILAEITPMRVDIAVLKADTARILAAVKPARDVMAVEGKP